MTCCGNNKILDSFRPDFRIRPITEKFYARHDHLQVDPNKTDKVLEYEHQIEQRLKYDPRFQSVAPITENQRYGWLIDKAIRYTEKLDSELFNHPKQSDELASVLKKIAYEMGKERRRMNFKK